MKDVDATLLSRQVAVNNVRVVTVATYIKHVCERLYKVSFLLFLLTLFWQLRYAPISRYAIYDYHIPFIYISDIFLGLMLISYSIVFRRWLFIVYRQYRWFVFACITIGLSFAVSNMSTLHEIGAWYRFIQFVLYELFVLWMIANKKTYTVAHYVVVLCLGLIPLILLGFVQVALGHTLSLGLIGEWRFDSSMLGIATVQLFGREWLRPYATFPHPNVFAATVGIFFIFTNNYTVRDRIDSFLKVFGLSLFGAAIVLSMSRQVWIALAIVLIVMYVLKRFTWSTKSIYLNIAGIIMLIVLFFTYGMTFFTTDQLSLLRRIELNNTALRMIMHNLFFGVGLNQFILYIQDYWGSLLPQFRQPVHNIYLLLIAETGLIGFGICAYVIKKYIVAIINAKSSIGYLLLFIALTGLFDHYWFTTHHGIALLSLTIGWGFVTMKT